MTYCKRCVMPDTRPGIHFNEDGICGPCIAAEKKQNTDWDKRMEELRRLCDKHRSINGDSYDCIIAVSGGKDSHFQTYIMQKVMSMNPLLVTVNNFSWTKAGRHNIENLSEAFGCDILGLSLNRKVAKLMFRKAFELLGSPSWYWDKAVYVYPIKIAVQLGIRLVVYGENVSYEYGGVQVEETPCALNQINNDVVKPVDWDVWLKDSELTMKDFNYCVYPKAEEIKQAGLEPVYLSYYLPWDGCHNYELAKRYGFRDLTHEWHREGYIEHYDQIDAPGYLVHPWLKYPKYGHARATDVSSYWIRSGRITREEGVRLVKENDHKLDQLALQDFLNFTGYTHNEFWNIVESFWNQDLFKTVNGKWTLKNPVWKSE